MDFIFDPSCVLYLPLHQLDGSSFMSRDAYGHLCTVTGAVWTPQGYSFDGADDVITVATHSALEIAGAITFMAWTKVDPSIGSYGSIFSKGGNTDADLGLLVSSNRFRGTLNAEDGGASKIYPVTPANLDDNLFRLWSLTYDLTIMRGYLNYTQIGTAEYSTAINTSGGALSIGNRPNLSLDFFGVLGAMWVYNRALTPLEIQNIYLATKWRYR